MANKELLKSDTTKSLAAKHIPKLNEIFNITRQIGEGTFSMVYLAEIRSQVQPSDTNIKTHAKKHYAIKYLLPTNLPTRVERELSFLKKIGGVSNVIGIECCLRKENHIAFVLPYMPNIRFSDILADVTVSEAKMYIKNLLIALERVHHFNVIHRDVKPANFLYDRVTRRYLLIDFGLAHEQTPNKKRKRISLTHEETDVPLKRMAFQTNIFNTPQSPVKSLKISQTPTKTYFRSPFKTTPIKGPGPAAIIASMKSPTPTKVIPYCDPSRITFKTPATGMNRLKSITRTLNFNDVKENGVGTREKSLEGFEPTKVSPLKCQCFGLPKVCKVCLKKKVLSAKRAGTAGYRPPEVLLKFEAQTTAIDIWAAGVMFLSLLSKRYPFFKSTDDFIALAEIITLFGSEKIMNVAKRLDRNLLISERRSPLDLRKLCLALRRERSNDDCRKCDAGNVPCLCFVDEKVDEYPNSAYSLLRGLLEPDPNLRLTAREALQHPFLQN